MIQTASEWFNVVDASDSSHRALLSTTLTTHESTIHSALFPTYQLMHKKAELHPKE